jgi:hypothetical protein
VGVLNSLMSRGEALSALPSAAGALICSSTDNIFGFDRGQRHETNECTLDAWDSHFLHLIVHLDLPLSTILGQGRDTVNLTLAAYSQWGEMEIPSCEPIL